eukprot:scaffold412_cov311-Pavlova_lutheri.AAC.6
MEGVEPEFHPFPKGRVPFPKGVLVGGDQEGRCTRGRPSGHMRRRTGQHKDHDMDVEEVGAPRSDGRDQRRVDAGRNAASTNTSKGGQQQQQPQRRSEGDPDAHASKARPSTGRRSNSPSCSQPLWPPSGHETRDGWDRRRRICSAPVSTSLDSRTGFFPTIDAHRFVPSLSGTNALHQELWRVAGTVSFDDNAPTRGRVPGFAPPVAPVPFQLDLSCPHEIVHVRRVRALLPRRSPFFASDSSTRPRLFPWVSPPLERGDVGPSVRSNGSMKTREGSMERSERGSDALKGGG